MVECRTRTKKDGGKYTNCYDEKSKPKPVEKAKPLAKAKPVEKAKPKPKLKVVEVVKPKVSEKAKAIIAAGKITNRLDDLPQELQDKIMKHRDEAIKTKKPTEPDEYSLGYATYPEMSMTTTTLNDSFMKEIFYRLLTDDEDNFKTPLIRKRLYNKIMRANAEEMASIISSYVNRNSSKRIFYFAEQRFLKQFAYKTLK